MKETERYPPPFCDFNIKHKLAESQILCVNSKNGCAHEVSMRRRQASDNGVFCSWHVSGPSEWKSQIIYYSESLTSEEVR